MGSNRNCSTTTSFVRAINRLFTRKIITGTIRNRFICAHMNNWNAYVFELNYGQSIGQVWHTKADFIRLSGRNILRRFIIQIKWSTMRVYSHQLIYAYSNQFMHIFYAPNSVWYDRVRRWSSDHICFVLSVIRSQLKHFDTQIACLFMSSKSVQCIRQFEDHLHIHNHRRRFDTCVLATMFVIRSIIFEWEMAEHFSVFMYVLVCVCVCCLQHAGMYGAVTVSCMRSNKSSHRIDVGFELACKRWMKPFVTVPSVFILALYCLFIALLIILCLCPFEIQIELWLRLYGNLYYEKKLISNNISKSVSTLTHFQFSSSHVSYIFFIGLYTKRQWNRSGLSSLGRISVVYMDDTKGPHHIISHMPRPVCACDDRA